MQMRAALQHPDATEHDRIAIGFALAKAMDDAGDCAGALAALAQANAIARHRQTWDAQAFSAQVAAVRAAFDQARGGRPRRSVGKPSSLSVFRAPAPPWSSRSWPPIRRSRVRANCPTCRRCWPRNRAAAASHSRNGWPTRRPTAGRGSGSVNWSAPRAGGSSGRCSSTSCPTTGFTSARSAPCCRRHISWCAVAIRWKPALLLPAAAGRQHWLCPPLRGPGPAAGTTSTAAWRAEVAAALHVGGAPDHAVGRRGSGTYDQPWFATLRQHDRDAGVRAPGNGNSEALVNWPRSMLSQVLANVSV
ncbi:hypothetical protein RLIN73S_05858 [Rhodanobacter lindaniclasticus]